MAAEEDVHADQQPAARPQAFIGFLKELPLLFRREIIQHFQRGDGVQAACRKRPLQKIGLLEPQTVTICEAALVIENPFVVDVDAKHRLAERCQARRKLSVGAADIKDLLRRKTVSGQQPEAAGEAVLLRCAGGNVPGFVGQPIDLRVVNPLFHGSLPS